MIEKTSEQFRLLYDVKGRFCVHRITPEEAKVHPLLYTLFPPPPPPCFIFPFPNLIPPLMQEFMSIIMNDVMLVVSAVL